MLDVKHVPEVCHLEVFVLLDSVRTCCILEHEVQILHHERVPHEFVLAEHLRDPHFLATGLLDVLLMSMTVTRILRAMLRLEVIVDVFFE